MSSHELASLISRTYFPPPRPHDGPRISTSRSTRAARRALPREGQPSARSLQARAQPITPQQKTSESLRPFIAAIDRQAPRSEAPVSSGISSTGDVASDCSFLVRSAAPLLGPAVSPAYSLLAITTMENVLVGPYITYRGIEQFNTAQEIGDKEGMFTGVMETLRGGVQGVFGATTLAQRSLETASEIQRMGQVTPTMTSVQHGAFILGVVSSIIGAVLFTVIGVCQGIQLYHSGQAYWEFSQLSSEAEKIKFIFDDLRPNTREKLESISGDNKVAKNRFKEKLRHKCLNEMTQEFMAWQADGIAKGTWQHPELSAQQMRNHIEVLFQELDSVPAGREAFIQHYRNQLQLTDHEVLSLTPMEMCGLKLWEGHRMAKKEVKWTRLIGSEALDKVKRAFRLGLADRAQLPELKGAANAELQEIIKTVDDDFKQQLLLKGLFTLGCVLAVTICVAGAGLFALPVAAGIGLTCLAVLTASIFLSIDVYSMVNGLKTGQPGPHDRKMLAVAAVVLCGILITAIVITAVFGTPLLPLLLTLGCGAVMLGIYGGAFYQVGHLEEKLKEEHPELAQVRQASEQEFRALYHQLPKEDRDALRGAYEAGYQANHGIVRTYKKQLEGNQADRSVLLRAAKRTAKELWAEAYRTGEFKEARAFQAGYDAMKEGNKLPALSAEATAHLDRNLYVILKRESSHALFNYKISQRIIQNGVQRQNAQGNPMPFDINSSRVQEAGPSAKSGEVISQPVYFNSFYDLGFDPRVSVDGNECLEVPLPFDQAVSRPLSWPPTQQSSIRSLQAVEEQWARDSYVGLVNEPNVGDHLTVANAVDAQKAGIPYQERQFFEQVGELYRFYHPEERLPARIFPVELLKSIHVINKPQQGDVSLDAYSIDLGRIQGWGFESLAGEPGPAQVAAQACQREFRTCEGRIEAVQALKVACRELRSELRNLSEADIQAGRTVTLRQRLDTFKMCWDSYIASHTLLQRSYEVFSQHNPFQPLHEERLRCRHLQQKYERKGKSPKESDLLDSTSVACVDRAQKLFKAYDGMPMRLRRFITT